LYNDSHIEMTVQGDTEKCVPLWQRLLIGRRPLVTLLRAAVLAILLVLASRYCFLPVRITGISMEPTCHDKNFTLVSRLAFKWDVPKRGDIVAIQTSGTHIMYMKRIVGMPGESISIKGGVVQINSEPLDEPYVKYRQPWQLKEMKLGDDEYLVIGDNRGMAMEQHEFGRAYRNQIVGKALW
jgi:signal peptidase I